jgi:prepilin signal peptidase PulO-like enzyme (type II secretory pathway)
MISNPDSFLYLILLVTCAAIGASIGSFLNVCIYRIPIGLTVTQPRRSFCPKCRHQVEGRDNIPVLSWLWLRGRCRHCKAPIPIWYFLIEFLAGLGAATAYVRSGLVGALFFVLFYSFAAYGLRTARGGFPVGKRLMIATAVSGVLILALRPSSTLSFLLSLVISLFAAREIVARWSSNAPVTDPNLKFVITVCALVSGMWAAVGVVVAIILLAKFTNAEERLLGYQDALILLGVSLGIGT